MVFIFCFLYILNSEAFESCVYWNLVKILIPSEVFLAARSDPAPTFRSRQACFTSIRYLLA